MKLTWKIILANFLLFGCCFSPAFSQVLDVNGQLSGWATYSHQSERQTQFGIRYIPEMMIARKVIDKIDFGLECAIKSIVTARLQSLHDSETNQKIKPYRVLMRFSTSQAELRFGLQKISFGSAQFIRPLMWFDSIDPRDPLQITDGVYGILFRYYFLNNTNFWLWGLYGNDNRKGWEFSPTVKKSPEFGGRLQLPFFAGEIALSFHHRQVDLGDLYVAPMIPVDKKISENRLAVDGKWDVGIGLWIEGVIQRQKSELLLYDWQNFFNLGMDYTFNLGNGLTASGEHFIFNNNQKIFTTGKRISFSALAMNYPVGLFDRLGMICYYDWENDDWYRFINWQRTYDNWSFHLFGFWNPRVFNIYQNSEESNLFAGKGIQIMFVFNH